MERNQFDGNLESARSFRKRGLVAMFVVAALAVAALAVGAWYYLGAQKAAIQERNGQAQVADSTKAPGPVNITVGEKITENGSAGVNTESGSLTLNDDLHFEVAFRQWIATGVGSGEKHHVQIQFDKRPDLAGFVHVQMFYTDAAGGKADYGWLISLVSGKVLPRTELSGSEFIMNEADGRWDFDVDTQSTGADGKMRLIIKPVLGGQATMGSAVVHSLSVNKV